MSPSRVFFQGAIGTRVSLGALIILLSPLSSIAKNSTLTAIEIYPASNSLAYVQIDDFALDTKNELRLCNGASTITKDSYGKLAKIFLVPGMTLERDSKGTLLLTRGAEPECVVPGNLKIEKSAGSTPAELADRATLSGRVISKSDGATDVVPPLGRGVKIVLVNAADNELAEFLWAQRSNKIESWNTYLVRYPAASHTASARSALAQLRLEASRKALEAFQTSLASGSPDATLLQQSKRLLDEATSTDSTAPGLEDVTKSLDHQVSELDSNAQSELTHYREAFKARTPGYKHLVAAESAAQITLAAEPTSDEVLEISRSCGEERTLLESRIQDANRKLNAGHPDNAYAALLPVREFAGEYSKIQDSLLAVYHFYMELGKKDAAQGSLTNAVADYQKAFEVQSTAEAAELLKTAQSQARTSADKAAVDRALGRSGDAESANDYVTAYEVLDALTPEQKLLVNARMDELRERFVPAATSRARDLQRAHNPIRGPADELAINHAYKLLIRSNQLTEDASAQDQIAILADSLSAYYLQQAEHYLSRPDGSGANVGWRYLEEALQYRGTNINLVRDQITRAREAHEMKSRLSIGVSLRDQTSRREAVDFVNQLTDALATGLESEGTNIKVVSARSTPSVSPNFQFIGDVLQNSPKSSLESVAKQSRYRSGEHEVPNEDWNAANQIYQKANLELQTAQHQLEGAMARGKKKQIEEAKRLTGEAEKRTLAAQMKLDAIPKNRSEQIERPYTYTERTFHSRATVELQFRILDASGVELIPTRRIPVERSYDYKVLEGVKPDDTAGVQASGEVQSQELFLEGAQGEARDRLLKQAKEEVESLPSLILGIADRKAADGDRDGAAELYILYLNTGHKDFSAERQRAERFLSTNYNFQPPDNPIQKNSLVAESQ